VFLTAKTTAMVCWLFVGSALFSGVFAILGGQALVEVLSLNMTPIQFMLLSQAIIFVLGWPLEWTEMIVIFVPIFLPLLKRAFWLGRPGGRRQPHRRRRTRSPW
jgi:TRAP-type mannitol/chloroaromatic compound transport system permease large subunit